jgi:outer membrane protein OmpA-like peptidoglycan-associated protein
MKRFGLCILMLVLLTPFSAFAESDADGCKDHPLFTRMKGYVIDGCETTFAQAMIMIDEDPESPKNLKPEGNRTQIRYAFSESAGTAPSYLKIRRNYQNAAKTLSAKILVDRERYTAIRIDRKGQRIFVGLELFNDGRTMTLTVLEQESMEQEVTADLMWQNLTKDGFMALYINFDTDKSVIKPDSLPIVDQVAELMKGKKGLKLSIEGHTDDKGTAAANKTLSLNRAKAVVKALTERGIAASRLSAAGWGQERPVADNRTEDGRAKNRRVEIVKK